MLFWETPPEIQAALWKKLVFIAAVSGAGALARATIGEIRECPLARRLLQQLMEEVVSVADARGVQLGEDAIARTLAFVESVRLCSIPPPHFEFRFCPGNGSVAKVLDGQL